MPRSLPSLPGNMGPAVRRLVAGTVVALLGATLLPATPAAAASFDATIEIVSPTAGATVGGSVEIVSRVTINSSTDPIDAVYVEFGEYYQYVDLPADCVSVCDVIATFDTSLAGAPVADLQDWPDGPTDVYAEVFNAADTAYDGDESSLVVDNGRPTLAITSPPTVAGSVVEIPVSVASPLGRGTTSVRFAIAGLSGLQDVTVPSPAASGPSVVRVPLADASQFGTFTGVAVPIDDRGVSGRPTPVTVVVAPFILEPGGEQFPDAATISFRTRSNSYPTIASVDISLDGTVVATGASSVPQASLVRRYAFTPPAGVAAGVHTVGVRVNTATSGSFDLVGTVTFRDPGSISVSPTTIGTSVAPRPALEISVSSPSDAVTSLGINDGGGNNYRIPVSPTPAVRRVVDYNPLSYDPKTVVVTAYLQSGRTLSTSLQVANPRPTTPVLRLTAPKAGVVGGKVAVRAGVTDAAGNPVAGARVQLRARAAGSSAWTVAGKGVTDAAGRVAVPVALTRTGDWRILVDARPGYTAAASNVARTTVTARFLGIPKATTVAARKTVKLRVVVAAKGQPSTPVRLQYRRVGAKAWAQTAYVRADRKGAVALPLRLTSRGRYEVRAVTVATAQLAVTASKGWLVVVR